MKVIDYIQNFVFFLLSFFRFSNKFKFYHKSAIFNLMTPHLDYFKINGDM